MIVHAEYPATEILNLVGSGKQLFQFGPYTYQVHVSSKRMQVIATNPNCVVCGIQSTVARLESDRLATSPHFNIYAKNEYGHLVLLTRDHIIPRAQGGSEDIINQQTMCAKCNSHKGSKLPSELADCYVNQQTIQAIKNLYSHISNSVNYKLDFKHTHLLELDKFLMMHTNA